MSERGKELLAIIAKGKPGKAEADEDASKPEVSDGMMAASEQLASLLGLEDSKVEAFAQALKDFIENC